MKRWKPLLVLAASLGAVVLFCFVWINVRERRLSRIAFKNRTMCVGQLYLIEAAKHSLQEEYGLSNGTCVTWEQILSKLDAGSIMPTGGVETTKESVFAWIKAGVAALGIGSNLISKERIAMRKWDDMTQAAAQLLAWIREARGK